jgi:hypothetical protein
MAAAVADYTFTQTAPQKIKKGEPNPEVHLVPTEDILKSLSAKKDGKIIVGFALETENVLENALKKLREKHMDMVVANNPMIEGAGFAGETNQVLLIHRNGRVNELPLQSKREIAREILNAVIETYRHPEPEPEEIERQVAEEQAAQFPDYTLAGEDIEEETRRAPAPANGRPQEHHQPKHPQRHEKHRPQKPQHEQPTAQAPKPAPPPPPKAEAPTSPPPAIIHAAEVAPADSGAPQPQGPKKSRSRRGGRRAKARAAKIAARQAATAEGLDAPQNAPFPTDKGLMHPVPQAEPAPAPIPQIEMAIPSAPLGAVTAEVPPKKKTRRGGANRAKAVGSPLPRAKKVKEPAAE